MTECGENACLAGAFVVATTAATTAVAAAAAAAAAAVAATALVVHLRKGIEERGPSDAREGRA